MNTTTSVSPTASLEIKNLFTIDHKSKIPRADAPTCSSQVGKAAGSDLSRSNSGYRRLTLREKLAKQKAEIAGKAEPESPSPSNQATPPAETHSNNNRVTKATSLGSSSGSSTRQHQPTNRSNSVSIITEDRTIFGFKVLKGATATSSLTAGKKNEQSKTSGFTRAGSLRLPRQGQSGSNSRTRGVSELSLFYKPKTTSRSEEGSGEEPKEKSELRAKDKLDSFRDCSSRLHNANDSVEEDKKECESGKEDYTTDGLLKKDMTANCKGNSADKMENKSTDDSEDNKKGRTNEKGVSSDVADNVTVGGNGEHEKGHHGSKVQGKSESGKGRTGKLVIRAESLQEGRSRLEAFREKQRRGNLTRSFTHPDQEGGESSATSKGKNISESLAEIRERIRERRRRKEQFKRSKSLPETESQSYAGDRRKEDSLCSERVDRLETVSKEIEKEVEKDEEGTSRAERERWGDNSRVNVEEERETAGSEKASEKLEETEKKVKASSKMPARGSRLISSFRSERKDEARASDKNKEASSTNEDSTLENKKPTKRERRRLERYQRAKTMSAIMYNDIASSASRDMRHNNEGGRNDRNERGLAIPSVSEMKKRFMEAEGGSTRMSPPGLFYTTKTSGSSETSLKKGNSRDREQTGMEAREDSLSLSKNKEPHGEVRSEVTKPQIRTKTAVSRRHTVPLRTDFANNGTFISEATIVVNKGRDTSLTAGGKKNEINQTGSNLPRRRHTFSDNSSASNTVHNSLKKSQSVEKLRERFSQGGAIYANKWAPSSGHDIPTRKISSSESEKAEHKVSVEEEATRRRIKSDDGVARMRTELYIDTGAGKASLLTRRHTIGNRPRRFEKQSFEANKDERKPFFEKFLAKDSEVHKEPLSGERIKAVDEEGRVPPVSGLNKASESGTSKAGQGKDDIKERKKGKDDASASKLRNLFPGKPASLEKKTRLRERRARTIGGSLSPETVKKLEINSAEKSPTNKEVFREHFVKPDIYVADSSGKENTRDNKPERRLPSEQRCSVSETTESSEVGSRRGSDLNPDTYLSAEYEEGLPGTTISSSDDTAIDSVFHEAETPDDVASRRVDTKTRGDTITSDRSLPQDSFATEDKIKTRENTWEPQVVNDSGIAIKDQCLDQYLTTIKTLAGSPKSQRASLRGSPQKSKLNGTQTLKLALNDDEEDDLSAGQNKHLSVAKAGLSMHSWSTSDLDKISPHGDGREAHQAGSQVEISSTDFDEISHTTTRLHSLTEGRTKARPKRTKAKSMNPLKSLMERTDVRTNTEEPEEEETSKSGFEKPKKRSVPRKKRSQLEPWRRHTLDPVALAALASREDFSRVSLRKTKGPGKEKDEYSGSMPVMLLQIKGRKQVQTRLVEPKLSSLNSGDCFILVTPKELFCWIGSNANTIEKAKAVEISTKIQKRGDLCCKTGDVLYIDEAKQGNSLAYKKFCKILEGDTATPIEDPNLCPHDEFYEREMISTNKVYKLQEGDPPHLIPVTELCGQMPTIEVLSTKEVFIFDFGSELYLWTGQQSLSGKRKVAFHLAQMLYKQPFQCEAVVNPIEPRRTMKRSQSIGRVFRDAEGNERGRPTWTLFGRLHEKAETLLFQEKFFDWPDPTKIIKMKGHVSSGELPVRPPPVELKPCDPAEMLQPASALEPVMLESTNLGRGLGTPNVEVDGVVREGDLVTTLGMTVWLVTQNKHFLLPKRSEGHFHSGHGYVIRWVYFVAKNRTVKDKRGRVRPPTGRQRTAYFFWQGNECSVNEKGAAAIMAVELDEERGPQIRVVEGKEPPHFLKLFDGAMIIHSGKRTRLSDDLDEFSDKSAVRMYCVRNEDTSEGCLVQVRRSSSSLRSRSSFVVVDGEVGHIFVWHGCKANEYHRKTAERAANFIKDRRPIEISLYDETSVVVTEMEEGREPESFWKTVGGKKHGYVSLLKDPLNCDFSPRLYHMTSATGSFSASEILCPCRYPGRTCPFPVLQDDLYSSSQPACFILDVGDELFVWEGWMPAEVTKDKKGPAKRRWDEERKLTLKTALSYAEEAKNRVRKGVHVVQAGLEPVSFTTHFPFWEKRPQVTEIKIKEGKMDCEKKPAKDVLDTFAKKYYSFKELTGDNPPDGVDLSKLESYLDEDEFERIFEMSRELFNQLPGWKQDILKKAFGLF